MFFFSNVQPISLWTCPMPATCRYPSARFSNAPFPSPLTFSG